MENITPTRKVDLFIRFLMLMKGSYSEYLGEFKRLMQSDKISAFYHDTYVMKQKCLKTINIHYIPGMRTGLNSDGRHSNKNLNFDYATVTANIIETVHI